MFVTKRNGKHEPITREKIYRKVEYFRKYIYELTKVNSGSQIEPNEDDEKVAQLGVTDKVMDGLYNKIPTTEIDDYTAQVCMEFSENEHPEYSVLAARIVVNNLHKNTATSFRDKMSQLYYRKDNSGKSCPLLNRDFYKFVLVNQDKIEKHIDYQRDYMMDYFCLRTLMHGYLMSVNKKTVERPQDMFMRVAITLFMNKDNYNDEQALENIFIYYDLLSTFKCCNATPTFFNAGGVKQQLSSCFLASSSDSLEGICKTFTNLMKISKFAGGTSWNFDWRGDGALIRGTNGESSGITKILRIFNAGFDCINQGGKRKGSGAAYIEVTHPDIERFVELKLQNGAEKDRARDLFYAVVLTDHFMRAVEEDKEWCLFCPDTCPGLSQTYGDEYVKLYEKYVTEGKASKRLRARDLWKKILTSLLKTGVPYVTFKDNVNKKNNLKHYRIIVRNSNLCQEMQLPADPWEYGVCNLASFVLPMFVVEEKTLLDEQSIDNAEERRRVILERLRKPQYIPKLRFEKPVFDYLGLAEVVKIVTRGLDGVIDRNYYPCQEAAISNILHRSLGMGVCGMSDCLQKLRCSFTSEQAKDYNKKIFETIDYAALSASSKMAKEKAQVKFTTPEAKQIVDQIFTIFEKHRNLEALEEELDTLVLSGNTDEKTQAFAEHVAQQRSQCSPLILKVKPLADKLGFCPSLLYGEGAPVLKGEFQWKMWGLNKSDLSGMWDWDSLLSHIQRFGLRNAMTTSCQPTATSATIANTTESFEPRMYNLFARKVLSGEFVVINPFLVEELERLGLWSKNMLGYLKNNGGSVQSMKGFPEHLKELYLTSFEMSQRVLMDLSAVRSPFISHSESFNVCLRNATYDKLSASQFYAWRKGLKTGCYYLRTEAANDAQKVTVDQSAIKEIEAALANVTLPIEEPTRNESRVEPVEECLNCSS